MASAVVSSQAVDVRIEKANFLHLVLDIAWFGLALAATTRFLTVYAIRLGAQPHELALMAALPGIALMLATGLAAWWRRRYANSVQSLFLPGLGQRLVFFLPALAPLFPPSWQPVWLILAATLPNIPTGIAGAIFNAMLREAISDHRMTALLSNRSMALNAALAIGTLGFGLLLQWIPFPMNYPIVFLLAFAASLISQWHVVSIRVKSSVVLPPTKRVPIRESVWFSRAFWPIALVTLLVHVGFFTLVSITPYYLVTHLGADESYIALFGMVELGAGAVSSLIVAKVMPRLGALRVIGLSMGGLAAAAAIFALTTDLNLILVGAALSGAAWSTAGIIGIYAILYERLPENQATNWSMAHLQMIAFGIFVGPILGDALLQTDISVPMVILICAGLRLVIGVMIYIYGVVNANRRTIAYR